MQKLRTTARIQVYAKSGKHGGTIKIGASRSFPLDKVGAEGTRLVLAANKRKDVAKDSAFWNYVKEKV